MLHHLTRISLFMLTIIIVTPPIQAMRRITGHTASGVLTAFNAIKRYTECFVVTHSKCPNSQIAYEADRFYKEPHIKPEEWGHGDIVVSKFTYDIWDFRVRYANIVLKEGVEKSQQILPNVHGIGPETSFILVLSRSQPEFEHLNLYFENKKALTIYLTTHEQEIEKFTHATIWLSAKPTQ